MSWARVQIVVLLVGQAALFGVYKVRTARSSEAPVTPLAPSASPPALSRDVQENRWRRDAEKDEDRAPEFRRHRVPGTGVP